MRQEIDDPRKWRVSMSGFSIKTGWGDEKKIIASYPGKVQPMDHPKFQEWLANAERICELYNANLDEKTEDKIMKIGGKYNWVNQPERLIYLGKNWSGNGYWHQFAKVDSPEKVWCEILDSELHMIEETKDA